MLLTRLVFFITFTATFCCTISQAQQSDLDTIPVFTSLENAMANKEKAIRLHLIKQKLENIPEEVFTLTNLRELVVDKNRITIIPNEIQQLQNLEVFSCQHNEIEVIPEGLLLLTHLQTLDMADNILDKIPDGIDQLQELTVLSLWDNPIGYYPERLSEMPNLKVLDLLHNQMSRETQERLKSTIPGSKIIMSPPCNCMDGDE